MGRGCGGVYKLHKAVYTCSMCMYVQALHIRHTDCNGLVINTAKLSEIH